MFVYIHNVIIKNLCKLEEPIFVNGTVATTSSYFETMLLNITESSAFIGCSLLIPYIWPLDQENSQPLAVQISSKIRLPIFFSIVKFLESSFKVFDNASNKPVSTDKADNKFLIYLVDGIVSRSLCRVSLYKLDHAFPHKTGMDE